MKLMRKSKDEEEMYLWTCRYPILVEILKNINDVINGR